jgi:Holliday junction resolvasome RuvABC endonuclease subunit
MEYVYCLDISLSCTGISLFTDDAISFLITSIDTKSGKDHQTKLKIIADKLIELKNNYKPKLIIIESGFTRFNASTQAVYKAHGVCQYLFSDIEQILYAPASVRKIVLNKGNAKKEEIRKFLENKYSVSFQNMDESDSFALGICHFIKEGILK